MSDSHGMQEKKASNVRNYRKYVLYPPTVTPSHIHPRMQRMESFAGKASSVTVPSLELMSSDCSVTKSELGGDHFIGFPTWTLLPIEERRSVVGPSLGSLRRRTEQSGAVLFL